MADFWIRKGWFKIMASGQSRLLQADWRDPDTRRESVRFLVENVLKKAPRDVTMDDFFSNRLCGLLTNYYNTSPYAALLEAGLVTPADEAYMRKTGRK